MGYEVDFLAVGEGERSGDAIALRFGNLSGRRENQAVIIIDGGFTESGEKLVQHVKKYYNTEYVDLVVSTHPDADHVAGLEVVLEKLRVDHLWMHQPWNHTDDIARLFKDERVTDTSVREALRRSLDSARSLERLAIKKAIPIIEPFEGVVDLTGYFRVLGPSEPFYESLLPNFRVTPEPIEGIGLLQKAVVPVKEFAARVAESWGYETLDDSGETTPENNTSVVSLLTFDGRSLLFTGDAGIPALTEVADRLETELFDISTIRFVQVPHHGSRRNVGPTILDRIVGLRQAENQEIKTAFVSAAKGSEPKHPAKKVVNAFRRRAAPVHATQGSTKWHYHDAPDRNWTTSVPLPFYSEVEE